jgi:hypothetical protein
MSATGAEQVTRTKLLDMFVAWTRGQVAVCCTTDEDVHAVTAVGDEPVIGLHVHGGNTGTIRRRSYDPATGEVEWFASGWADPSKR